MKISVQRALTSLLQDEERKNFQMIRFLLSGSIVPERYTGTAVKISRSLPQINGKEYRFQEGQHKTLLRLLRDEGLLTGTKKAVTRENVGLVLFTRRCCCEGLSGAGSQSTWRRESPQSKVSLKKLCTLYSKLLLSRELFNAGIVRRDSKCLL